MKFNNNFKFEKLFLNSFYENPHIFLNRIKEKKFPFKKINIVFRKKRKLNFNKSSQLNLRFTDLTMKLFYNFMNYKIISNKKKRLKEKISWVWSQNFQLYNNMNNNDLLLKKKKEILNNITLEQNLFHKLKMKKKSNYKISNNIYKTYFFKNNIFYFKTCYLKRNKIDLNKLFFFIDFFIIETQQKIIKFEKNNCIQNQYKLKKLYFKHYFFYLIFIPFTSLFYKRNFLKIEEKKFNCQLEECIYLLKNIRNSKFKTLTLSTEFIKILFRNQMNKKYISYLRIQKEKRKNQNDILNFIIKQFLIRNLFYFFSLSSPSFYIYPITKSSTEFSFLSPKIWSFKDEPLEIGCISNQKIILESKNYLLFSKILPINIWNKFQLISFFDQGPQYNCQSYNQNLIQEIFLILSKHQHILTQTYSFIFKELFQNIMPNIFREKFLFKNHILKKKNNFLISKNHIFFQNMQIDIYEKYIEESIFNFICKKILKFQTQIFLKKKKYFDIYKKDNLIISQEFKENFIFKRINYTFISKKNIFLFGSEKLWYSFLFFSYFNKYFKQHKLLEKGQKFYFSHSFLSFKNQKNGIDFLGFNVKYLKKKRNYSLFLSSLNLLYLKKFILIKKNFIKKPIFKKYKLLKIIPQLDFFLNLVENLNCLISNFCQIKLKKTLENSKKEKKDYYVRKFIYFNEQKIFLNFFFLSKLRNRTLTNNFFYKTDFYFALESIVFKEFFVFKRIIIPSKENIRFYLQQIKNIIKESRARSQEYLMNKLSNNIKIWSFNYQMIFKNFFKQKSNSQIYQVFSYCNYVTFKYLWNWACRRHPNKSKKWIKEKYFNYVEDKKWVFSQFNSSKKYLLILRKH